MKEGILDRYKQLYIDIVERNMLNKAKMQEEMTKTNYRERGEQIEVEREKQEQAVRKGKKGEQSQIERIISIYEYFSIISIYL